MTTGTTTRTTIHGNPGDTRILPAGLKVRLSPATNLPGSAEIKWWAAPVDEEAEGWPTATLAWAADVGLGLGEGDVKVDPCPTVIDLRTPVRSERIRSFQPPWRTVFVYRCPTCGAEHRVGASRFLGRRPTPEIGGFVCGR